MDIVSWLLSRKYTDMSIVGLGSIRGANCTVKDIVHQDGVNTVTFEWVGTDGTTKTREMSVYDGTPIYVWESGNTYHYGDLAIYESQFYRCIIENSDATFDNTKWNEIGSPDGNYDIVQSKDLLPARFTAADRKLYFVIDECIFYLWDGYQWVALNHAVQLDSFPVASEKYFGKIYQYIGTTTNDYTHGYFYQCVSNGETPAVYTWEYVQTSDIQIATVQKAGIVKPDGETIQVDANGTISVIDRLFVGTQAEWDALTPIQQALYKPMHITDDEEIIDLGVYLRKVKIMPNAEDYPSEVVMYIGNTDANYTRGYNYRSTPTVTSGVTTYHWEQIDKVNPDEAQKITGRYNVLNYGLVNDGTTDNTTALRNMLATIPEGSVIYFPQGTYNISDTIEINKSMSFIGDTIHNQIYNFETPLSDSIINYSGSKTNVTLFKRINWRGVFFKGLTFKGNAFTCTVNPNRSDVFPKPIRVDNVIIEGISAIDLHAIDAWATISDCLFYGFSGFGVKVGQHKYIINCGFHSCNDAIQAGFDSFIENSWICSCHNAIRSVKTANQEAEIENDGFTSVGVSDTWADQLSGHFYVADWELGSVTCIMDNIVVDLVDESVFYMPNGQLMNGKIQGYINRYGMACEGIEESEKTAELLPKSCCIYADRGSTINLDITTVDSSTLSDARKLIECPSGQGLFTAPVTISCPNRPFDTIFGANCRFSHDQKDGYNIYSKEGHSIYYDIFWYTNGRTSYEWGALHNIPAPAVGAYCLNTRSNKWYMSTKADDREAWISVEELSDPSTDIDFTTILGGE